MRIDATAPAIPSGERSAAPFTRYVAIGDSFTEGMADPDPRRPDEYAGWADRLAAHLSERARMAGGDATTFGYAKPCHPRTACVQQHRSLLTLVQAHRSGRACHQRRVGLGCLQDMRVVQIDHADAPGCGERRQQGGFAHRTWAMQ